MQNERRKLPDYAQPHSGKWIVVEENKRAARFHNPCGHTILVIHTDGGLITSGERADYIVAHSRIVDVIVELKGSDVTKAIHQIRSTRPVWILHELAGKKLGALVVRSQGIHPKESASIDRWKREFRKNFKMKLVVETRNRNYEFAEFRLPE
jgi:hypothetical protein